MKKILIIIVAIIITIGVNFTIKEMINNENERNIDNGDMIIKIENIKNESNNGYVIYKSGIIEKQNYISGKVKKEDKLSKNQLTNLLKLVNEIDESKVYTINTLVAVTEGQIITIFSSNTNKIIIKDFYSSNYSDAAKQIIEILEEKKLL